MDCPWTVVQEFHVIWLLSKQDFVFVGEERSTRWSLSLKDWFIYEMIIFHGSSLIQDFLQFWNIHRVKLLLILVGKNSTSAGEWETEIMKKDKRKRWHIWRALRWTGTEICKATLWILVWGCNLWGHHRSMGYQPRPPDKLSHLYESLQGGISFLLNSIKWTHTSQLALSFQSLVTFT